MPLYPSFSANLIKLSRSKKKTIRKRGSCFETNSFLFSFSILNPGVAQDARLKWDTSCSSNSSKPYESHLSLFPRISRCVAWIILLDDRPSVSLKLMANVEDYSGETSLHSVAHRFQGILPSCHDLIV